MFNYRTLFKFNRICKHLTAAFYVIIENLYLNLNPVNLTAVNIEHFYFDLCKKSPSIPKKLSQKWINNTFFVIAILNYGPVGDFLPEHTQLLFYAAWRLDKFVVNSIKLIPAKCQQFRALINKAARYNAKITHAFLILYSTVLLIFACVLCISFLPLIIFFFNYFLIKSNNNLIRFHVRAQWSFAACGMRQRICFK